MWLRPAFAAPYGARRPPEPLDIEAWLEMLMMLPPVSCSDITRYALVANTVGAVRLRSMMAWMKRGEALAVSVGG